MGKFAVSPGSEAWACTVTVIVLCWGMLSQGSGVGKPGSRMSGKVALHPDLSHLPCDMNMVLQIPKIQNLGAPALDPFQGQG